MNPEKSTLSRRKLVTHLGAGIAGAALTASVPAIDAQTTNGSTTAPFVNPIMKYPKAGQPAELASIYVQLAANEASYTTGNIYGAGGGGGQP